MGMVPLRDSLRELMYSPDAPRIAEATHEEGIADEINKTDSDFAVIRSPPGKTTEHNTLTMIFSSDPGTWPPIPSDTDKCFLVKEGSL
ncbi:hypothetical protein TNCV_2634331 [Trichonephila clavipes]|nr:hypothetical protein TNCV_2634331 [Trichonephila clavipes]